MRTESGKTSSVTARTTTASSGTPVARRKSSSTALFFIAFLAAVGGGGGAWLVIQRGQTTEAARKTDSSAAPRYLVHLEGFTVNLADPEDTHFLRVTMDLGVDRLPPGSNEEKSTAAIPVGRVRDGILSVLTACKADPLLTSDGKTQLKKSLVDVLQRQIPELGVREVYFTEFLVQR